MIEFELEMCPSRLLTLVHFKQGSVTSSIIGFFSGMGDAAKEFGIPEGGCEGVSSVSFRFFCSPLGCTKTHTSPLVPLQLVFSKDGGSDGLNEKVRWSCLNDIWTHIFVKTTSNLCP